MDNLQALAARVKVSTVNVEAIVSPSHPLLIMMKTWRKARSPSPRREG
ncbi:hypothetical protein A2U01_0110392 [Trifolium medium]|uniref:Uncharacterized protein n=1 Tax=Trifolium medium TaxID=97028 RepID=A0A392VL48_9FABA|nr:hypothetical protein [Trifolium medium]